MVKPAQKGANAGFPYEVRLICPVSPAQKQLK